MTRYNLLYFVKDAALSAIIQHDDRDENFICNCLGRLEKSYYRDHVSILDVRPEVVPYVRELASYDFHELNKARDFVACETFFFTVRSVSIHGCHGNEGSLNFSQGFRARHHFACKFIHHYAFSLLDLVSSVVKFDHECLVKSVKKRSVHPDKRKRCVLPKRR